MFGDRRGMILTPMAGSRCCRVGCGKPDVSFAAWRLVIASSGTRASASGRSWVPRGTLGGYLRTVVAQPLLNHAGYLPARPGSPSADGATPLTWPDASPAVPENCGSGISGRSRRQYARPSDTTSDLGLCRWQVLGSNQRRLSRRFYRPRTERA